MTRAWASSRLSGREDTEARSFMVPAEKGKAIDLTVDPVCAASRQPHQFRPRRSAVGGGRHARWWSICIISQPQRCSLPTAHLVAVKSRTLCDVRAHDSAGPTGLSAPQ